MLKICSNCFNEKSITAFNKHKLTYDSLDPWCRVCKKSSNAKSYKENIVKERAKRKSYYNINAEREKTKDRVEYLANPEKVKARVKKRQDANPGLVKGSSLKRQYWPYLTWQEALAKYNNMLKDQNGLCAICGQLENSKHQSGKLNSLAVDHCHTTLKIRNLLCSACNKALGLFKDDLNILEKAIAYKRKHL